MLHGLPHKRQVKFRFLFVVAICTQQPFLCFPVLSGGQGLARPQNVLQRQWKDNYQKLLQEGNKTFKNHLTFFCRRYSEHFVMFSPTREAMPLKCNAIEVAKDKNYRAISKSISLYD